MSFYVFDVIQPLSNVSLCKIHESKTGLFRVNMILYVNASSFVARTHFRITSNISGVKGVVIPNFEDSMPAFVQMFFYELRNQK